jgi:hypothetical protein
MAFTCWRFDIIVMAQVELGMKEFQGMKEANASVLRKIKHFSP